jgi:hypothetical protein
MERRHPIELVRCGKRRVNGLPCQKPVIPGGSVCRLHGGGAPQVVAVANQRVALASDPVARRLIGIAMSRGNALDLIAVGYYQKTPVLPLKLPKPFSESRLPPSILTWYVPSMPGTVNPLI